MKVTAILLLPVLAATVSCGGGGSAPDPQPANEQQQIADPLSSPTDSAIISKVYDPYYSVPADFFVDERSGLSQSYTVHHVLDESGSYEMCTDDLQTASAWESTDNASRSVSGYYVGAYENDRYFEFIRELSYNDDVGNVEDLTSPGFARIFKCSNTSRIGVDRAALSGFAGRLNGPAVGPAEIRNFAEYLWQFAFFPTRYKKVLDSQATTVNGSVEQTLLLGFASGQGFDRCDLIEVVEWRFTADPASGDVYSNFALLRSFEARLVEGSPQLCE